MSLTKKDFKKVAEFLNKNTYTQANDGFKYLSLNELMSFLIELFESENKNFNKDLFVKAVFKE